jgi:hypothetical protein
MEGQIIASEETLFQARLSVLTAQNALHAAMAGLLCSKSLAGVKVAKVSVATALLALEEIVGPEPADEPQARRCIHCGSRKILESLTAGGTNLVCGDCGEDPEQKEA